jgi:hypothetical protein
VTRRGACKNRRFGVTYRFRHQVEIKYRVSVTSKVVPSSLMPSVLTMTTWLHIPEDGILHVRFEVFTMVTSGMLRRVALVRTDGSEDLSASFIRVTRNGELGITPAVTSNRRTLRSDS